MLDVHRVSNTEPKVDLGSLVRSDGTHNSLDSRFYVDRKDCILLNETFEVNCIVVDADLSPGELWQGCTFLVLGRLWIKEELELRSFINHFWTQLIKKWSIASAYSDATVSNGQSTLEAFDLLSHTVIVD